MTPFKRHFTQVGKPAHISGSPTYASVLFFSGIGINHNKVVIQKCDIYGGLRLRNIYEQVLVLVEQGQVEGYISASTFSDLVHF
ncbi:hypothetical protein LC608_12605 [Nostoc sp. XA010]|uniref:hypothetical protein n=1 Tax=Nostoc sp. XA010 TaxID=2780407 RepID=UPI001E4EF7A7|nr:hypothetical protein [Nostoc sp. XA010]MCC5657817.1 hypothetical protein [Nostoc sp. XA010]